ncbi:hypothetical protein [Rhizobium leguminosarum]|nr:hypothetical protein [Rhizobium leguminosarum]
MATPITAAQTTSVGMLRRKLPDDDPTVFRTALRFVAKQLP